MPRTARPRRVLSSTAASVLAITSIGCGGVSADDQRERLADDLIEETDGALDDTQARCVADALQKAYGDDSFQRVLDAAETQPSGSSGDDDTVRTQVIDIFAACDALEPIIDHG